MNCPTCGSPLKEHKTTKGALFLTCSRWPSCPISGTPALLERFEQVSEEAGQVPPRRRDDPLPLGAFIRGVAQLRIHQAKLAAAKTAEERAAIRKQALEALK